MAYNYRGRRVAYDNISVGSISGIENTIGMSTLQDNSTSAVTDEVSLWNPQTVSLYGNAREGLTAGSSGGTVNNISVSNPPGIEDTENSVGDKFTSDGETITDNPGTD